MLTVQKSARPGVRTGGPTPGACWQALALPEPGFLHLHRGSVQTTPQSHPGTFKTYLLLQNLTSWAWTMSGLQGFKGSPVQPGSGTTAQRSFSSFPTRHSFIWKNKQAPQIAGLVWQGRNINNLIYSTNVCQPSPVCRAMGWVLVVGRRGGQICLPRTF